MEATSKPPVLIIHGTFSTGTLMEPWRAYFEAAGYEAHAPALPGREPTELAELGRLTFDDLYASIRAYRGTLDRPPIVIGHSMGGLLAQRLAAETETAALVLLTSVPPGVLWAQPAAAPHLMRILPSTLAGKPIRPPAETMHAIVFNDLGPEEARELEPQLVTDSGRAFRSLVLGTQRIPKGALTCPVLSVSGGADRNVAPWISRAIARRYNADTQVHPERGHWIVAPSKVEEVAGPVLGWVESL
jgi:pimeloyl-ACP methyl ester carboxylesterase